MRFRQHKPFKLSVRKKGKSTLLNTEVRSEGNWPYGEPEIIILLHGYNTTERQATEGYDNLLKKLRLAGMPEHYQKKICQFYWPGDWPKVSEISYPFQLKKAKRAAEMLWQYLAKPANFSKKSEFVFIAHSLGCRLVLEILLKIITQKTGNKLKVKKTILMAAAVPVYMVKSSGKLAIIRTSNQPLAGISSERDCTLKKAFPIGQSAAFEGVLPQAIGYKGNPTGFFNHGLKRMNIRHGDYWSNNQVAEFLANQIKIPVARTLPLSIIPKRNIFCDGFRKISI